MALPFDIPDDLTTVPDDQLRVLRGQAVDAATPLRDRGLHSLSADERQTFRDLTAFAVQVDTEINARTAELAAFAATQAPADPQPEPVADPVIPNAAQVAADAVAPTFAAPAHNLAELVSYTHKGAGEFSGLTQMGAELEKVLKGFGGGGGYRQELFAEIHKSFAPEDVIGPELGAEREYMMLTAAADEHAAELAAIASGNITAAAAYCSPSQTVYDLCELETDAGIYRIRERLLERGGVNFTTGPDFASIFAGAGYWAYTEAQIIANTPKPCMEIECPPFVDRRLVNLGVCVTGSLLQRRGYPELIARFLRGAMTAHRHRVNAFVLAEMATLSTLVDLSPIPAGSLVGDNTASGLLAAVEMVATDLRYRNRMDPEAVLEAVVPVWGRAQLRADVSRRTGVDMISVRDAEIMSWFSDRHLAPSLVYDWQDASTGTVNGPGAVLPGITTFPADIEVMIFPGQTFVKGTDPTIRLETVYDSVKLSTNQYTALFTEEGVTVLKVCPDARRVIYPLCPTGATTEPVARSCA